MRAEADAGALEEVMRLQIEEKRNAVSPTLQHPITSLSLALALSLSHSHTVSHTLSLSLEKRHAVQPRFK